jgi:adenylylsulfate kinase
LSPETGFTVWLTGISGAGKTTIAGLLAPELERCGHVVERLDGDVVRRHLSPELGFSRADRDTNIERIGWLAARFTRLGAAVLVSAISPYRETRDRCRAMIEEFGAFVEVLVYASVEDCVDRDPKGLYKRALAGEVANFTGVSDPYEPPANPDVTLNTALEKPEDSAERALGKLLQLGLVRPALRT